MKSGRNDPCPCGSGFALKGAMLFRVWGGANFHATKDLDFFGRLIDVPGRSWRLLDSELAPPAGVEGVVKSPLIPASA
jgi:hypothetical protein